MTIVYACAQALRVRARVVTFQPFHCHGYLKPARTLSVWITTLGQVRVIVNGRERSNLPRQRLRCALLIYIAVERDVSRDALIGVFWPDKHQPKARHILSQHLYQLRGTLGDDGLIATGDRVCAGNLLDTDVGRFESRLAAGEHAAAIELYGGAFLEGFSAPAPNALDMWVERRRAHLTRLHRRARKDHIEALLAHGEPRAALDAARAWAEHEPTEDEAQHACLELLLRAGEVAEARARFDQYEQQLRRELDVAPLEDTVALFSRVHTPLFREQEFPEQASDTAAATPRPVPLSAKEVQGERDAESAATPSPAARGKIMPASRWRRRSAVAAGLVVALIAVIAAIVFNREPGAPQVLTLARDPSTADPSRIAVLYFEDLSENQDLGHIAAGLTLSLIDELTEIDALSVISRFGVRQFADNAPTIADISSSLGAGSIVTGTVQRSGDSLRVSVQLIDAQTGNHQSTRITRQVGELFQLQDDIADHVSRFLRDRLGREIERRRRLREATSTEAWLLVQEAVTQAEEIWRRETLFPPAEARAAVAALDGADQLLQEAHRLDRKWTEPILLRGWVALARAKVAGFGRIDEYNDWLEQGVEHADRILAQNAGHARALELRGTLRFHGARANRKSPDAPEMIRLAHADLDSATRLEARLAGAWNTLSRLRQYSGDPAGARDAVLRAQNADAYLNNDADIQQRLWRISFDLEEFDQALQICQRAHENYPEDYRFVDCQLSIAAMGAGPPIPVDSAAQLLDKVRELDGRVAGMAEYRHTYRGVQFAVILARNHREAEARDSLARIRLVVEGNRSQQVFFGFEEAYLLMLIGDQAGAIDALGRYLTENPQYRNYVRGSFVFAPLRDDPRFNIVTGVDGT